MSHKNIAGVGLCTLVSAGFFEFIKLPNGASSVLMVGTDCRDRHCVQLKTHHSITATSLGFLASNNKTYV